MRTPRNAWSFAILGLAALLALTTGPARAADAIYPAGSHIGLVPAKGLTVAATFPGFEDKDAGVKVVAAELPPPAFYSIAAAMRAEAKNPGMVRDKARMFMSHAGFGLLSHETTKDGEVQVDRWGLALEQPGFTALVTVQVPASKRAAYSEDVILAMLASVTVREDVPAEEQLSKMPFRLKDLASFKSVRTIIPGAAVLLSDREAGEPGKAEPYMILSAMPGGPARPEDRARFAEQAVLGIQGLENVKVSSSEPMRLGGQQAFETRFTAKDQASGAEMTMIQWLRFGNTGFLLMIAGAPNDDWREAFPRFRKVRDAVERP